MNSDSSLLLVGTIIGPDELLPDSAVLCRGGIIAAVGPRGQFADYSGPTVDAGSGYIGPGYVDLHVHGGDGADYMDGEAEAVVTANRAHARHGTTSVFPTTTTGSPAQIVAMLDACAAVQERWSPELGARIPGVHFYGPYFAPDKVGCHAPHGRRDPDAAEYLPHLKGGLVKIATCAAELPGSDEFYAAATAAGCLVTCGHSNATWTEMQRAFDLGMRHVDHFWCAMSSVPSVAARCGTPMQGSMEQFTLFNPEMSTEVLADGYHLARELLEYAFRLKGAKRLCLVTDTNRALDQPPGRYRFGNRVDGAWFESDGKVGFEPGHGLASTVSGMDTMVANMWRMTSATVVEAVRMGSLTPAERAGVGADRGSIEVGKRADILVLDGELGVKRVFLAGEEFGE